LRWCDGDCIGWRKYIFFFLFNHDRRDAMILDNYFSAHLIFNIRDEAVAASRYRDNEPVLIFRLTERSF
jgi:hypothetical protein